MTIVFVVHPFEPLFDENSKILILGSFPSVKSRETSFYYGHGQNRFWYVMAALLNYGPVPRTIGEKKEMLLSNGIALWDTIASCDIKGSSDSSITNVTPNDLSVILDNTTISVIGLNGTKSYELFMKYTAPGLREKYGAPVPGFRKLPSTSPANAAWSKERLIEEWGRQLFG